MLIGFPPIFEADTQKFHGYNFVVPLKTYTMLIVNSIS